MADKSGQADIRGIDIDKAVKGFADEALKFKNAINVSPTSAREIRWYKKTAGFLDSTDTTGMTASRIANVAPGALPESVEASFTRTTSYVRKYFVESPTIPLEDLRDSDPDILGINLRDLARAVAYQVDARIYTVVSDTVTAVPGDGANTNDVAANATWGAASGQDPIEDISDALRAIQTQSYDTNGAQLWVNPAGYKELVTWLVSTKGVNVPMLASELARNGILTQILGVSVVVSNNCTDGYGLVLVPKQAATWKQFVPITTVAIDEPGIGTKIRSWEEGECIMHDPLAVTVITGI